MLPEYDDDACNRFADDMRRAGVPVRHLVTFNWEGPAVLVEDPAATAQLTQIPVRSTDFGLHFLVHPVAAGHRRMVA